MYLQECGPLQQKEVGLHRSVKIKGLSGFAGICTKQGRNEGMEREREKERNNLNN